MPDINLEHLKNFPPEAQVALSGGNKIEAIKIVRKEFDLELVDAKRLVERYIDDRPELKSATQTPNSISLFKALLIFGAIVALGMWLGK